jgi:shikimate dehydrogenase
MTDRATDLTTDRFTIDTYAVIGNPIAQSKSPLIHASFAASTRQNLVYTKLLGTVGAFAADVDAFRARGARGMNVTAPFKLDAFAYATQRSEGARMAGAANALKFDGDQVLAENFDGLGLVNDIQRNLGVALAGKRVLLLGAGGAARGALLPIVQQMPQSVTLANRSLDKAHALTQLFDTTVPLAASSYTDLNSPFDVVINATSASLFGELPPLPYQVFAPGCLAYEMVYGKGATPFLQLARSASVQKLADGVGMLVEQAAEAFVWWRGVRPETASVIAAMTVPII